MGGFWLKGDNGIVHYADSAGGLFSHVRCKKLIPNTNEIITDIGSDYDMCQECTMDVICEW